MRIKVLHLPAPADVHEFALIFDGVDSDVTEDGVATLKAFGESAGAKASLISSEPVEVD